MNLRERIEKLKAKIEATYESSVTMDEAEKLAAEFLYAMISISTALKEAGLDSKMRKRGFKAIKSAVRIAEVQKHDKKPTEGQLEDLVNTNELCMGEEEALDSSLENKEELERLFGVFREAHIYYRGVAKGNFNG